MLTWKEPDEEQDVAQYLETASDEEKEWMFVSLLAIVSKDDQKVVLTQLRQISAQSAVIACSP